MSTPPDYLAKRIRVAKTPEEFNECFASGEVFEADVELAASMGCYPTNENVLSDAEFFAPPDPDAPQGD